MALNVMKGLLANAQGVLVDPEMSAWRVVNPQNTANYILVSSNVTGTGNGMDARNVGGVYGNGFLYMTVSGVPATGTIYGSMDSANWTGITSVAGTAGTTAWWQWSGYYPYLAGTLDYVSAGARTAFMTLKIALK